MVEAVQFKRGYDLEEETRTADEDTVICVACGKVESDEAAYENHWQLAPPVCPDCLHWEAFNCCSCS
jgi:hypothetical protein